MAGFSADEKSQLISRVDSITKFFENNVSDFMKTFILGGTEAQRYTKRIADYVVYINNIFSLAFIFARGCLRCDNDSDDPVNKKASKQSSMRIINSLRKAYVQYPANSELIQFVLSDIQFEMLQGRDSELYDIFEKLCSFRKDFSLTQYYKVIAEWKVAPSRFNMNLNVLAGMFLKLLQNMTFIKEYDLLEEDGNFVFIEKEAREFDDYSKYSVIPVNHLIYYNPNYGRDAYALYGVERIEEDGVKTLGVRYISASGYKTLAFTVNEKEVENEDSLHVEADADDYFYEIIGEDWSFDTEEQATKKNDNFIDQVHAINYKYIKNLALAISDAISVNMGSKKALYKAFHLRHKDVFDKISSSEDIENIPLDWDGIVVMLLIESSPTSVLEALFKAVPQTFITVAKNLCKRVDNPDMKIYGLTEKQLIEKVDEIIKSKIIVGETGGFGKVSRAASDERLRARASSLLIVSSLSSVSKEDAVEKTLCAGNIYDNIALLKKIKGDESAEQKCKYVSIILGETFRHLTCFYKGLIDYGEIKAIFDAASCNNCAFDQKTILDYQKKMQGAFMSAAKAQAEQLKQYSSDNYQGVLALMQSFIGLCEKCSSSSRSSSIEGHKLYSAIGKHDIINVNEFKSFVLGYTNNLVEINERNVDEWITFALEVLRYLRTGSAKSNTSSLINAVYPFTATYNRGNENYDGYKTVTFVLNINKEGEAEDSKEYINVLSEFIYGLNNVFYCLPNILRSNKKWWIDPVLINFKSFNDIFEETQD